MEEIRIDYKDKEIKRQIIMEHYSDPQNKPIINVKGSIIKRKSNHSCMDDVIVSMLIRDDVIVQGTFEGISCALTTASTDIMLDIIKNKTIKEAKILLKSYQSMVNSGKTNNEESLKELVVFINTNDHPNRMNCVLMSAEIILEIIEEAIKIKK